MQRNAARSLDTAHRTQTCILIGMHEHNRYSRLVADRYAAQDIIFSYDPSVLVTVPVTDAALPERIQLYIAHCLNYIDGSTGHWCVTYNPDDIEKKEMRILIHHPDDPQWDDDIFPDSWKVGPYQGN